MPEYDNSGALFKNDRKEQANHPDYKGSCTIDGVEYWMSAWIKEGKSGKFMSMSFKPKEEKPKPKQNDGGLAGMDDDIPFDRLRHELLF